MKSNQKIKMSQMFDLENRKNSYSREDLVRCAQGNLFGKGNPQLPNHPMLMFDRIIEINDSDGKYKKGKIIAELDINPDLWFFHCHFIGDPVMPGCLGLDAMWQLIGFFLGWVGGKGHGRALGSNEVKFTGQVLPHIKKITYEIDIKRVIKRDLFMGIANGTLSADGRVIYAAEGLKVGLFTNTENF